MDLIVFFMCECISSLGGQGEDELRAGQMLATLSQGKSAAKQPKAAKAVHCLRANSWQKAEACHGQLGIGQRECLTGDHILG